MPSRCPIPSEKPLERRLATSWSPTTPSTSSTRAEGIPPSCASDSRWFRALRPPCTALASSSAPTWRGAFGRLRKAWPPIVTWPEVGRSRPSIIRMVVDLPDPLGPRKPVTAPGRTWNERLYTAVFAP